MPEDTYTHGHQRSVLRSHTARTIANSAAYLEPYLQPGAVVVDVGCGPGTISAEMAQRVGPEGFVLAVDRDPGIVAAARQHAAASGVTNLSSLCHSGYELGLVDSAAGVVHAHQVLQHVSRPVDMLREFRRVVTPSGVVGVRDADYSSMSWFPELPDLDRWMAIYQAVARHNDAEPDAGRRLLGWAHEAGFAHVRPSASVWCFATPEDRAWWGGLWADRIVDSSLAEQAVSYGLATVRELGQCAAAFRAWADHPHGWFSVVHGEVLCTDDASSFKPASGW